MMAQQVPTQRTKILKQLDNLTRITNDLRMLQTEVGMLHKRCGIELDVMALLRDEVGLDQPARMPH